MPKKILFIARDGTLIVNPRDNTLESLTLQPHVIPSLLSLQEAGYVLVMLANEAHATLHRKLIDIFISQGVIFENVLISHGENDSMQKPNLGLVRAYLKSGTIDFNKSYVIGQGADDRQLAENMALSVIGFDGETMGWQRIVTDLTTKPRMATVSRVTKETDIQVTVNLDKTGGNVIETGLGFFDHMLDQIATHGGFYMHLITKGDLHIDDHHTIEDTALALGQALRQALGDKRGIVRFAFTAPMDECLAQCALDLSGRAHLQFDAQFSRDKVGDFSTEMTEHFFRSLSDAMACTLHLSATGQNDHHIIESLFKVFARTLRQAIRVEGTELPSSKGALS